jgi:hypothetical protein
VCQQCVRKDHRVKPLRKPYSLIDELAPLLHQKTKRPCFHNIRIDTSQLLAMSSKKIEQQAGSMWIAFRTRGSEALTIIG